MIGTRRARVALMAACCALACGQGAQPTTAGGGKGVASGTFTVTVQNGQNNSPALQIKGGKVFTDDLRIECGVGVSAQRCSADFPRGTTVVLKAAAIGNDNRFTPSKPYMFLGWAGDCSGDDECTLTGNADKYVVALFSSERTTHANWSDAAVHGPRYYDFANGVAGALECTNCHGANLQGQGIAIGCGICHRWPRQANASTFTISGNVSGATAGNVAIVLTGPTSASTTTDASGNYSFGGLLSGRYTLTPSKAGYEFSPAARSVDVTTTDSRGLDFTAAAIASGGWIPRLSGTANALTGIASSGSRLVAVGFAGTIISSQDGSSWQPATPPCPGRDYYFSVTYGGGMFVAVGTNVYGSSYGAIISTSADGIAWSPRTPAAAPALSGVAYGDGAFVAVGHLGTIQRSTDGVNWSAVSSGTSSHLNGIAFVNGSFVAVGDDGTILRSIDGVAWTQRNRAAGHHLYGIAYAGGTYVVTGEPITGAGSTVLSSTDLTNWTDRSAACGGGGIVRRVTYGDGSFVMVDADGITITPEAVAPCSTVFHISMIEAADVLWTGSQFVAVGGGGTILTRSGTPTSWRVTTFAGAAGVSGTADGSAATFSSPTGVAADRFGNVFVADFGNSTVRKITPGGVVTTIAGMSGVPGTADGIGANARLNLPAGVAVDRSGNVYVADDGNSTIRKITSAGVVTTIAGAPGVSGSADGIGADARFDHPTGVAVDGSGNIYVADSGNNTIRKITTAGVVSTLVGSAGAWGSADGLGSSARFWSPTSVAVDPSGNVYVTDYQNATVRMIDPAGRVTTLAGSAMLSGSADGAGASARFYGPCGVTVDDAGNVYVADFLNSTVRRITAAGSVTTVAGSAGVTGSADGPGNDARFNHPQSVAVDSLGNVYVADTFNNTIRKVTGQMGAPATYTISGTLSGTIVSGVTVSLSGAATKSTTTDQGGHYTFAGLGSGDYTVTPEATGYTFSPPTRSMTITIGDLSGADFSGAVTAPPPFNPVVSMDPPWGPKGTIFHLRGTGFIPNGNVWIWFKKPDGTRVQVEQVTPDSNGEYTWDYDSSIADQVGLYDYSAIDLSSRTYGYTSNGNVVRFYVGDLTFASCNSQTPVTLDALDLRDGSGGYTPTTSLSLSNAFTPASLWTVTNHSTDTFTGVGIQNRIEQGSTSRFAGGFLLAYGPVAGWALPGVYTDGWWWGMPGAGSEGLVPGPAELVSDVICGTTDVVLSTLRTPIQLVP